MKKMFMILAAATLCMAACKDKTDAGDDKKMSDEKMSDDKMSSSTEDREERNKKTALASVEAFAAHNVDGVLKDASDDITDFGDGSMPPSKGGKDSAKVFISSFMVAFPDAKGENLKAIADGDWVVVWGDWSGSWKGDFMGQKPTGKAYKFRDVDIFKFNDEGKITEHHNVQPFSTTAMQVGMKMK